MSELPLDTFADDSQAEGITLVDALAAVEDPDHLGAALPELDEARVLRAAALGSDSRRGPQ